MNNNKIVPAPEQKNSKKTNWFLRFLKWIFPWKGDRPKMVAIKCVFLACIAAFAVSGWLLADYYIKDFAANEEYMKAQSLMNGNGNSVSSTEEKEQLPLPAGYREQFNALYQINQKLCGWLKINGTGIDYPVVHPADNDYYLHHTFYDSYSSAGVPFLDYRCDFSEDNMSGNTIIYGHNLNSGRMFHDIVNYKNVSYYKEHPVISYNTVYADHDWKIIGMFFTNADMSLEDSFAYHMFINKQSDEEFYALLNEAMQRSFFTTGVDVNAEDKLLMLSTCDNAFDNSRLVLLARMVRPGESSEVDVSAARQNASQYLPQNYIDKLGGTYRPWDENYAFYRP